MLIFTKLGDTMRICFRCSGRKKVFKMGNGYTLTQIGGIETNCPLCKGTGKIDVLKPKKTKISDVAPKLTKEMEPTQIGETVVRVKKKPGRPKKVKKENEEASTLSTL